MKCSELDVPLDIIQYQDPNITFEKIVLFAGLEYSMQMDFVDSVVREDVEPWKELTTGKLYPR